MKAINKTAVLVCLLLLCTFVAQIALPALALAADEEMVALSTKYPELKGTAVGDYSFDIEIKYSGGTQPRFFNLSATGPDNFFYSIQQSYGGTADIASVKIDPVSGYGETVKLKVTPNIFALPDPGEYTITFKVASDDVKSELNVKVVITSRFSIDLSTPDGVLSGQITESKDNFFKVNVKNNGSSVMENINLTSRIRGAPSGWDVTFDPEKIDTLAANNTREVKVNIKPTAKTISGDYEVVITAKPENASTSDELTLRVTVLTRTIWGWVGVAIVVLVVAGLIAMFIFMGRR
ncbi:MAG TPA: NEW3 domain-containing protein [Dehalococcoidia bacterium]|nr:NEW3 domain-containing protein [Dehalococcoidia bacterium]